MLEITKDTIEKAAAKAREVKPLVKVIEFRRYQVTNKETGATYEVRFNKVAGRKLADCNCKSTRICYHIAASIGAHIILAEQMHNQR